MSLRPQDLLVLYKKAANPGLAMTYAELGEALGLSASQVHRGVQRCLESGLAVQAGRGQWQGGRSALIEFSLHGVRYVFPTKPGAQRRGLPTAYAAAPLKTEILSPPGDIPVWPHPEGTVKGSAIEPLCPQVPEAALRDERLYQMLALLDALRIGLEAFIDRGGRDLFSHDLEDVLNVVDGRLEIVDEISRANEGLRAFVARELGRLLANADFSNALPGLLEDELRVPVVLERLRLMSQGLD